MGWRVRDLQDLGGGLWRSRGTLGLLFSFYLSCRRPEVLGVDHGPVVVRLTSPDIRHGQQFYKL